MNFGDKIEADEILGQCGELLSHSKSFYVDRHLTNTVVFNANVCTKKGKIWFGDLDLTLSSERVQKLANVLNQTVYVLRENDARFDNEDQPLLEKAVSTFEPEGDK